MTNSIIDALLQKTVKINLKYLRHKYVLFSKKFPLLAYSIIVRSASEELF